MDIKPRHSHDSWCMIIIAFSHYRHDRPSVTISMIAILIRIRIRQLAILTSLSLSASSYGSLGFSHRYPLSASASPSAYGSLQRPTM